MADNPGKGKFFLDHFWSHSDWGTDDRAIVWFDIDNTLYSASTRISHAMGERIHGTHLVAWSRMLHQSLTSFLAYFVQLGLSHEEANELHHHYYKTYGLALRGLVKHHDVGEPTS